MNKKIDAIGLLVKSGTDIDALNGTGVTALHMAATQGSLEVVEQLVKQKADINVQDTHGNTALQQAIANKHLEIIEFLYQSGALIDAQDLCAVTALHTAAAQGELKMIELLVKLGANADVQDDEGATPLDKAIAQGQTKAIELLVKLGAKVNIQDAAGDTYLHKTAALGQIKMAETLVKLGANVQIKNNRGATALHAAVQHGQAAIINFLVNQGVSIDAQDEQGYTPLHWAAANNHLDAVKQLIRLGAKLDIVNIAGYIPYMLAIRHGYKIPELLINKNIDGVLKNNLTQLGMAACAGDVEMLRLLIAQGADLDSRDGKGYTALERAIHKGQLEAVRFLEQQRNNAYLRKAASKGQTCVIDHYLGLGVDINSVDGQGRCAAYYAALKGQLETLKYLVKREADLGLLDKNDLSLLWVLLPKYEGRYLDLFTQLVALQNNVLGVDDQKRNLSHLAARYADKAMVKFLLELQLDYEAQDARGQTVLHWAAQNPDETVFRYIIDFLVQHSCQYILDIRDNKGETALHTVARFGTTEMIGLCEEYRCDFASRNNHGQAPRDIAQEANRSEAFMNEIIKEDHWMGPRDINPDFVKTVNTEQFCSNGMMPLEEAIMKGKIPPVCYWVAQKADLELVDKNDLTFLRTVLKEYKDAYRNCFITLLALQTDIHQPDVEGATLLHFAARYADVPALKILLDMGMDLNAVDHAGYTVLHKAILNPNCTVFRYLAQTYPTLLSICDAQGETVVHLAARLGSSMMITLCKAYGLDFGARNNPGQTPLEVARQTKQPQAIITQIQACTGAVELALAHTLEDEPAVWSACDQARTQLTLAEVTVRSNHTQEAEDDLEHGLILLGDFGQVDQDLLLLEDGPDDDEDQGGGAAFWAIQKMAW